MPHISLLQLSLFIPLLIVIPPLLATQPGGTVIACGGFVRWKDSSVSSQILFHKLKVNVFSEPSRALQDITDVLPNGAYSVALYDQGPYRLSLVTPKGWHVYPADGHLIDIRSDPDVCVGNLDFVLSGFTVYGQVVTYGLTTGPSGLNIRMTSNNTSSLLPASVTEVGGYFALAPILPGVYEITVSDGAEQASEHVRARVSFTLGADSLSIQEPLILMGHFVHGRIVDFQAEALAGVTVHLFMDSTQGDQPKVDCNMPLVPSTDLPEELRSEKKLVCVTKTDNTGHFSFDRLPGGKYAIFPHYSVSTTIPSVSILFSPMVASVAVEHADLDLGQSTFQAEAFELPAGKVVWPDGTPLPGAKVYFGDRPEPLVSDSNGFYQPGFIKPRQYTIKVEASNVRFSTLLVELTPSSQRLPTLQPSHLALCGRVEPVEKLGSGVLDAASITIIDKSTGIRQGAVAFDYQTMHFCGYYVPGHYDVTADIRFGDRRLHFAPDSHSVHLSNRPILDLVFTQFRANVTGRVHLLSNTADISSKLGQLVVRFRTTGQSEVRYSPLMETQNKPSTMHFELTNMLPGDYHVDLVLKDEFGQVHPLDGWCWKPVTESQDPNVSQSGGARLLRIRYTNLDWHKDPALLFEQSGYAVRVQLETPLAFSRMPNVLLRATASSDNHTETLSWQLPAYSAQICLPSSKQNYRFTQSSPCVDLIGPVPVQILPSKDCHTRIVKTPTLRLSVNKVPVMIRLAFSHPFGTASDRELLTKDHIPVDVTEHGETLETDGITHNIFAKWSSRGEHGLLYAEASVKVNPNHMINIKPRPAPLRGPRWSYTYLLKDPITLVLRLRDVSPIVKNEVASYPVLVPSHDSSAPTEQSCYDLYRGQTAEFDLELAVLLRGLVQPGIPKVEVSLFRVAPSTDSSESTRSPLLPLHGKATDQSNYTENDAPSHVLSPSQQTDSFLSAIATTLTDTKGVFFLGPIPMNPIAVSAKNQASLPDPRTMFRVELSKPGYEFSEHTLDDKFSPSNWVFKATKLSLVEVLVQTKSADKRPLQGVLVSIIGEGHRGNQFTDHLGMANFVGLAPGQYYLRAVMKEHVFTVVKPKSENTGQASPILIKEGASVRVEIEADRVAFSASGMVVALGDNPEANVLVEASWISHLPEHATAMEFPPHTSTVCQLSGSDASAVPREQSWTDSNGTFWIRGLLPGCYYAVSVYTTPVEQVPSLLLNKAELDRKPIIDRAIPEVLYLLMPPHDALGLKFIAIQQAFMSTLTVSVDTDDEFVSSLRLTLFPLDRPDHVVAKHDFSKSLFFMLPHSKMRHVVGRDHILRLETTLEPALFTDIGTQQMIIHPKVDESQHFTFNFHPKPRLFSNSARSEL
ncbi:Nodal modulator 2 [Clonorchis sinensis]|uniref:Nodal modulator 2 n=1 Tax=Clonorchis sinensis TaxID=79923 RepID=A0A8T1MVA7_CLOSI|nr:Nodal modulator 2 [Clonorchis sinensis]